jgi:hypothetical protein
MPGFYSALDNNETASDVSFEPLPTVTQLRVSPFSVSILSDTEIQKNNCQYIPTSQRSKTIGKRADY